MTLFQDMRGFRASQLAGNFQAMGRIIGRLQGPMKGIYLGRLACEVAIRKRNLRAALHILSMARRLLIDEYRSLEKCQQQEQLIRKIVDLPDECERLITLRAWTAK